MRPGDRLAAPSIGGDHRGAAVGATPGQGRLGAGAGAGALHAALAARGAWPVLLLAGATVALAGGWRWLLGGHRHDLTGAVGVLWVAAATASIGSPVAAALATAAGVATLSASCRSAR